MLITTENACELFPSHIIKVLKNGCQIGNVIAVDTETLEFIQKVPSVWGRDWRHGDPIPDNADFCWVRSVSDYNYVWDTADAVVITELKDQS